MIRFAYPNIINNDDFAGCGRYLTTDPNNFSIPPGHKLSDNPEVGNLSDIIEAVSLLAPEAFDSPLKIYEYKDVPSTPYKGASMGLAYFLALLRCASPLRWDENGYKGDIWCTGRIELAGNELFLKAVFSNLFPYKLQAFLRDTTARIFFIPLANMPFPSDDKRLFETQQVRVLSVEQLKDFSLADLDKGKTIVRIQAKELEALVGVLFSRASSAQQAVPSIFVPPANPYRGLFAFREEDSALFFGREEVIEKAVQAVQSHTMLGIIGASGSGKSSLVFAGLLPRLRALDPYVWGRWRILTCRPGDDPFMSLTIALLPYLEPEIDRSDVPLKAKNWAVQLKSGAITVSDMIAPLMNTNGNDTCFLLFFDQFEEVFTINSNSERQQLFLENLLLFVKNSGAANHSRFRIVLTMRADFLGKALNVCSSFSNALDSSHLLLAPMGQEELRSVIEKPASNCGIKLDDGLTERILQAVGDKPGNLPLLEFALSQMWSRMRPTPELRQEGVVGMLTHEAYDEIKGVEHALAAYAENVYHTFSELEQNRISVIFMQLISPGEGTEDTRRIALRRDIAVEDWKLVTQLADKRLVVTGNSKDTVELVHEALITHWQRLQKWIEQHRKFRTWQERLRTHMRHGNSSQSDPQDLLQGFRLTEAEQWLSARNAEHLLPEEADFIRRSLEKRDLELAKDEARRQRETEAVRARERIQRQAARRSKLFAVVLLTLTLLIGFFWRQERKQTQLAEQKTLEALSVSATALLLNDDELGALKAAIKAGALLQRQKNTHGLDEKVSRQFQQILNSIYEMNRFDGHSTQIFALTADPVSLLVVSADIEGQIILWDAAEGKQYNMLRESNEIVSDLRFSADGTVLVSGSFDGTIVVWNAKSGEVLRKFAGDTDMLFQAALSSDGKLIASGGQSGEIDIWDANTGDRVRRLPGHDGAVSILEFHPTRNQLFSSGDDGIIRVWDLENGSIVQEIAVATERVDCLAMSPDGLLLAVAGEDYVIRLWNSVSGQLLKTTFQGHSGQITSLAFRSDAKLLASGSEDGTVRLWRAEDGKELLSFNAHKGGVEVLSFVGPGNLLVSAGSETTTLKVWNLEKRPLAAGELPEMLSSACDWIGGYLRYNALVDETERTLCGGIKGGS